MPAHLTSTPITLNIVHGAAELEQTERGLIIHRLPAWARAQNIDPQLAMAQSRPSGVRLAFQTTATIIELDTFRTVTTYAGLAPRPAGVLDLLIDGEIAQQAESWGGTTMTVDLTTGLPHTTPGPVCTTRFDELPSTMKTVEIWLPHNENLELIDLRTNAAVTPIATNKPLWLHHGSSISHGSNATNPTGIWPAVVAHNAQVELRNLGFGGSALLDPFVARTIRDSAADMISLKLGINLVNADLMRLRALGPALHGFLDTIREGHPTTPLLVVSPIYCGIHEDTPGPSALDTEALGQGELRFRSAGDPADVTSGKLTLRVIRDEMERVIRQRQATDPGLYFLNGLSLYGLADTADFPLPDALHPDASTHRLIGERFVKQAFGEGLAFSGHVNAQVTGAAR